MYIMYLCISTIDIYIYMSVIDIMYIQYIYIYKLISIYIYMCVQIGSTKRQATFL